MNFEILGLLRYLWGKKKKKNYCKVKVVVTLVYER